MSPLQGWLFAEANRPSAMADLTRMEQIAAYISLFGVVLIARPVSLFSSMSESVGPPTLNANTNVTNVIENDTHNEYEATPSQRAWAVGVAMLGVVGAAGAYTTIRWIGKRAHPLISVNYFATWCTIVSTVMMFALPGVGFLLPASLKDWGYLIFLGTCGFATVRGPCAS
jgi:drug/metabolite transporter (DMT)-like permease